MFFINGPICRHIMTNRGPPPTPKVVLRLDGLPRYDFCITQSRNYAEFAETLAQIWRLL